MLKHNKYKCPDPPKGYRKIDVSCDVPVPVGDYTIYPSKKGNVTITERGITDRHYFPAGDYVRKLNQPGLYPDTCGRGHRFLHFLWDRIHDGDEYWNTKRHCWTLSRVPVGSKITNQGIYRRRVPGAKTDKNSLMCICAYSQIPLSVNGKYLKPLIELIDNIAYIHNVNINYYDVELTQEINDCRYCLTMTFENEDDLINVCCKSNEDHWNNFINAQVKKHVANNPFHRQEATKNKEVCQGIDKQDTAAIVP